MPSAACTTRSATSSWASDSARTRATRNRSSSRSKALFASHTARTSSATCRRWTGGMVRSCSVAAVRSNVAGSNASTCSVEPAGQFLVARELGEQTGHRPPLAVADLSVGVRRGQEDVGQRAKEILFGRRRHRAGAQPCQPVRARRAARRRGQGLACGRALAVVVARLAACTHEVREPTLSRPAAQLTALPRRGAQIGGARYTRAVVEGVVVRRAEERDLAAVAAGAAIGG